MLGRMDSGATKGRDGVTVQRADRADREHEHGFGAEMSGEEEMRGEEEEGGEEGGERGSPLSASPPSSSSPDPLPIHVVKYSDPVDTDLLIDTEALHNRYRFFEERLFEQIKQKPKRFIMTPPRHCDVPVRTRSPEPLRDPNVVRCSDPVVDDLPKTETARKMLHIFRSLEAQTADRPEQAKLSDDVPVEPDMARSLRAKFENWTSDAERDNNNKPQPTAVCDSPEAPLLDTAKTMKAKFESQTSISDRAEVKPLKRITPPRELDAPVAVTNGVDVVRNPEPEIVRSSIKSEDVNVIPVEPEMARSLRAKFEKWATDVERDNNNKNHNGAYDLPNDYTPQLDMAKNLKAKFESFRSFDASSKPLIEKRKPRVNRFVQEESQNELCSICGKILYALEKVEFGGAKMDKIHKSCFKCTHCQSSLRLDNYTLAAGKFYCLTHFKQLFMAKGNYDEGFGREQHKEKWNSRTSSRNQTSEESEGVDSDAVPVVDAAAPVLSVS